MKIIPGHSIGDFKIGDNFFDHRFFNKFIKNSDNKYKCDFITIRVDKQGIIDLVATYSGAYKNITTDKTFRQIINEGAVLLYDEFDQVFYLKEPEGLCIGKSYDNISFNDLLDSKIEYLNIFDLNSNKEFRKTLQKDFEEISIDNLKEN
ncbi:MAG: hypothetical protein IPH32_17230 [Bacteroidetes bacterium]|nr:hypothetical protein [Bacteroidota bacterium]